MQVSPEVFQFWIVLIVFTTYNYVQLKLARHDSFASLPHNYSIRFIKEHKTMLKEYQTIGERILHNIYVKYTNIDMLIKLRWNG